MKTTRGITFAVLATAMAGLVPASAQPAARPARAAHPALHSSVWLPYWTAGAASEVSANADLFRTASLFWFDATCSSVHRYAGAGGRATVRRLHAHGLRVVATVVGAGLSPAAAVRCFTDPARRRAHVRLLVRLAERGHYGGIDVDYETLAHTTRAGMAVRVRAAFDRFVAALCPALRRHGKQCIVAVMPRVDDSLRVWHGKVIPGVYDYSRIAAAADRMQVMAYDQHWGTFGPGPVAGYRWVRRVIAYTAAHSDLNRVELGVPLYGRDFAPHGSLAITSSAALALARRHGVTPHFDRVQREETYRYRAGGVRHTVWFSNPRAVADRTRLAIVDGLAGAAYWAAGEAQPGTWQAVRRAG